jgi:S1-C subfamily serine protease
MKMRRLAGVMLLPIAVWAQQPSKQTPASAPSLTSRSNAVAKTPPQILDENRASIAVIVAAGNTSLKLGTGFFVGAAGLLLTNFHVVEGMELVGVKTPGGNEMLWAKKATGFDLDNDLVVLRVEANGTKPVALGDSDQTRVGEQIVVVGNPEGLEQTVSNGLVSGIREVGGRKLFQISAPISEGSSGSPVFNSRGDVIAVAVSSLESGQNLNFAIPINYAKPLLTETAEKAISSLPRRNLSDAQSGSEAGTGGAATDAAKLAAQAMSRIADEIRACEGSSTIIPTKAKKPHYSRVHSDPATDVRFDVKTSDSLVAPFQGIIEFSIHHGLSLYLRTADEAASAPDNPMLSFTTRYRYFYRINGSSVQLDYRTYFDSQRQDWVLEQGKSDACWDRIGNQQFLPSSSPR